MKAPTPNKKTFPPSWRKWRKVKEGEALRATDQVVHRYLINGNEVIRKLNSVQLGAAHAGFFVKPAKSDDHPYGWYYRKVS